MEAQKLTLDNIQSKIESATYLNPVGTLTIAILTLTNGYTVTGESACLNPADFDADLGKKIAYEKAEEKVWMLEGYLRKEIAFNGSASVLAPAPPEIPTDMAAASTGPASGKTTESVSSAGQTTIAVDLPTVSVAPHDDMVPYLGVKIVNAKPMSRGVYVQLRGWDLPTDEDPADAGYLVEYTDAQRPNVTGFLGYVSWSPADVFMAAYSPLPAPATDVENAQSVPVASNGTPAGGANAGNDPTPVAPIPVAGPTVLSGGDTAAVDNPAPAA